MLVEPLTADHWEKVLSIYQQGMATGNATFELTAPGWKEWDEGHLRACRLVR
jgi:L-amino acid N-acyltransferase YncA